MTWLAAKKAYDAARYAARREEMLARNRKWNRAHRDSRRIRQAAWYLETREQRLAQASAYAVSHRAERCLGTHRRRTRIAKGGIFRVTPRDWQRLVARYQFACAYCGSSSGPLQQEHVVPIVRGGRHSVGNLVPSCSTCNLSKGNKLLIEWKDRR